MLTLDQKQYLRAAVRQIEGICEQRRDLDGELAGEYEAAGEKGLDKRVLKALVAKRRKVAKEGRAALDFGEELLHAYELALDETPSRAPARPPARERNTNSNGGSECTATMSEQTAGETASIESSIGERKGPALAPHPPEPAPITDDEPELPAMLRRNRDNSLPRPIA